MTLEKGVQLTQHRQQTGLDNLTSAVVRYQLWFGQDLSD